MTIQIRLKELMEATAYNMKTLSLAAELNETAVRDILKGRVKSPRFNTIEKLSIALECTIEELTSNKKCQKTLLNNNTDFQYIIDEKIFIDSVIAVDKIIELSKLSMSSKDRALAYIKQYKLLLKAIK